MRALVLAVSLLLAASSARAQLTSLGITREFYGCNGSVSCHWVTFTLYEVAPQPGSTRNYTWLADFRSVFLGSAGVVLQYQVPNAPDTYGSISLHIRSWNTQEDWGYVLQAADSPDWIAAGAYFQVSYGPDNTSAIGGVPGEEDSWVWVAALQSTSTPEPSSLLLMGTGVLAICVGFLRRNKV